MSCATARNIGRSILGDRQPDSSLFAVGDSNPPCAEDELEVAHTCAHYQVDDRRRTLLSVVDAALRLSLRLRTFAIEWFDTNGPREGHRLWREADPIVARLVFQSSLNRQARDIR
jgi:hypothetical protein